jgi:5-methylcytosine-specific restriction endonuclease McrA
MTVSDVKSLTDDALRHGLHELVVHDRKNTVRLLIHLGEFDSRRLYRAEGYSWMNAYCIGALRMSEDVAKKRIRVARKARLYPRILSGLADGSLTLTSVSMLCPYLTDRNAAELLHAAEGKTLEQVAELIAEHFPQADLPSLIQPLSAPILPALMPSEALGCQESAARHLVSSEPMRSLPPARVTPLAPERYGVQFTMGREDKELLEHAKAMLVHQMPSRDEGQVFLHALRALVRQLERRKFGATDRPRRVAHESDNSRYVPALVRRTVRERDGDQCTYVAQNGHRCQERRFLEFDHVEPVARGGKSTVENLRLRCRAHNAHEAEQTYGDGFMAAKIEESRATEAKKRADEIVPWLRALGIRADHARQAAEQCDAPGASLEDRVKAALKHFAPRDVALRNATPA